MEPHFLFAAAGFLLAPALIAFAMWLSYCAVIDKRHAESPNDAGQIIEVTGRWFPMRLRSARRVEAPVTTPLRLVEPPRVGDSGAGPAV